MARSDHTQITTEPVTRGFPAGRLLFLIPGALALLTGMGAGLVRLGWVFPLPAPLSPAVPFHGTLMVGGFLGTLISLERAVALGRPWTYGAPGFFAAGGILLLAGQSEAGLVLLGLGGVFLVVSSAYVVLLQPQPFSVTMLGGSVLWLAAALWTLHGSRPPAVVLLWVGFLLLTIAGERLELGRLFAHSGSRLFVFYAATLGFAVAALGVPVAASPSAESVFVRVAGVGMVALACWLLLYDIARRTVRQKALVRFIAVCLLGGYGWLGVAGGLLAVFGLPPAGLLYDAILHAFFLGFVFSMIFGHAPIILPAVLQIQLRYSPLLYLPLVLLHASLGVRIVGDLMPLVDARLAGGALGAVAILGYFLIFVLYGLFATFRNEPS